LLDIFDRQGGQLPAAQSAAEQQREQRDGALRYAQWHMSSRARVLFVCLGNTCRSVFAEYLANSFHGQTIVAESVGLRPQPAADCTLTIETLATWNIDASAHIPRGLGAIHISDYDLLVMMDPKIAIAFRSQVPIPPTAQIVEWTIADPWTGNRSSDSYIRSARQVGRALQGLEKELTAKQL